MLDEKLKKLDTKFTLV